MTDVTAQELELAMPKTHINATHINAPIETVWSILTATDKALPFFFGSICDTKDGLKPGASYRMVSANRKLAMVVGEVLAFEPPRLYSHTFAMTNIDEPSCTVTYRLTEENGGTKFVLEIDGPLPGGKLEKQMLGAQDFIGSNLKAIAETGRPAFSGKMVTLLGPVFGMLAKKEQRIENWPL